MAANRDKSGEPLIPIEHAQMISLLHQQYANLLELTLCTEAISQKGQKLLAEGSPELVNQLVIGLKSHFDRITQRIVNLGGVLHTSLEAARAAKQASMALEQFSDEKAYVRTLLAHYATMATSIQTAVEEAEDTGDPDTTDLLMHLLRTLEKSIQALMTQLNRE